MADGINILALILDIILHNRILNLTLSCILIYV
jgi:hypothetical protein